MVRQLWATAQTPFDAKYDHSSLFSQPVPDNSEILSCFPSLPIIRERSAYVADALSRSKFFICTKKSSRHITLLPGIFSLYCEHGNFCTEILHITCICIIGICYGFEVMEHHESPNTPFTLMIKRFKQGN